MQSSDPNFRQSADCRKLASPAPKKIHGSKKKIEAVFLLLRSSVCSTSKNSGFCLREHVSCPFSPEKSPTPNFILVHPSTIFFTKTCENSSVSQKCGQLIVP